MNSDRPLSGDMLNTVKLERTSKHLTADTPNLRHYASNILTEVDGDTAHSRCFLMMTSTTQEHGTKIVLAGEYEDRLIKHEEQWRFAERTVSTDGA